MIFRRSLRARLVGSFLVLSLLTVGVIGYVVNVRATDDLRTAVLDQLNTAADARVSVVERWLDEQHRNVLFVAGLLETQDGGRATVGAALGDGTDADAARDDVRSTLAFAVRQTTGLQEVMLLDADGTIRVSTFGAHEGVPQGEEGYFTRGLAQPGIEGVFDWSLTGAPTIMAMTPVEVEGERAGVLAAVLDLSRLHSILLERVGIGESGTTILVSPDGRPVRGRLAGETPVISSDGIAAALAGENGQGSYVNHEGTPVIGSYRHIDDIGSALLAEMSQDEAFAPARDLAFLIGLVALVSVALLAVAIWVVSGAVTKPILGLASTATRVAGGDLDVSVPVTSEDEVGTLERAFNEMTAQLRESVATLEQRVEARTAALNAALQAQTEAEARYRKLVEELPLALYIDRPDALAASIYTSPMTETMFGYPAEAWTRDDFFESILHPDDRARVQADHEAAFERGDERWAWDFRVIAADGRTVWVHDEAVVVKDEQGIAQYVQGFMQDVTEERLAEAEVRRQKSYFEALVDASPVAIVVMDRDEIVTAWNPAAERLFGYGPAEAIGTHIDDLIFSAERRSEGAITTTEAREQGRSQRIGQRRRRDGRMVDVEIVVVPLRIDGEHVGYYAIYHDISELEEARKAAEGANQAKSAFLAAMSHEIRTPMNAIIGMSGLLSESTLTDEQHEYAETIRVSGEALLTIINDILDFSKIEAGRVELEEVPFAPHRVIEGALDVLAPAAAAKGIELAYEPGRTLPPALLGDAGRLRQILLNLLSNAVKFTERGEVVLAVDGRALDDGRHELAITVRDTGIGIPPDRMDRLFQSFSQLDASVSRRYGGTGLGLAISRRLAELMDGSLTAASTGLAGEGTTFTLVARAPLAPDGAVPAIEPREPGVVSGRCALVVDDNATNRRILELQLDRWGMEARVTGSPREAVRWVRAGESFDVALLDLHMDEMDGVALAGALRRARGKAGPIPAVILSSVGATDRSDPAIVASLTKPVKPSLLYDALAEIFGVAPARPAPAPAAGADTSRLGVEHPLRILLAEDNAMNRRLALVLLERMGYAADVATNGREAIEAVERSSYDVILMDVQMPEVDGMEAARRIVEGSNGGPRPRIIALTANAMAEDREAALGAGMDDYLAKPIRPAELADALRRSPARADG